MLPTLVPYIAPTLLRTILDNPEHHDYPVAQRFPAAVLFADVSGFTPLTESLAQKGTEGPEELTRLLNTYFTRMIALLEEHGGEVAKFSGDALTVLFPAEQGRLGEATQLARQAAQAMQAAMVEFAELPTSVGTATLGMKIGIGSGEVIAMQIGGVFNRWEYVVAGDPLRQVAAAESQANRGEILLSPEAAAIATNMLLPLCPLRSPDWSQVSNPAALESAMRHYIPGAVMGWLQGRMQEWIAVLRPMSVLFMGVGGLDYQTDNDMERLHTLTCAIQKIVYRYEGSLNKVVVDDKGTVFLVLFGAPPLAHEDDALRAMRCAVEIQEQLHGDLRYLGIRVALGIATGRVFAGPVGSPSRREYTVIGDTVNLAVRLMGKAGQGGILCDSETYRHTRARVEYEVLPPIRLKGKDGLIQVYRPIGNPGAGIQLLLDTESATPLIGRSHEMQFLETALDTLQNGHGQTILLQGEAGIGKSRLIVEFDHRLRERGLTRLLGAGSSTEQQTPYRAWRDIFLAYFDLDSVPDMATRHQRIERVVRDLATEHMPRLPLLNDLLNLQFPETDLTTSLDPARRQQNLTLLLLALLRAWAKERPLVIVIEDANWLDSLSWEFIIQATRTLHASGVAMLLLIALRHVESHTDAARHLATLQTLEATQTLRLTELNPEETIEFVAARLRLASPEELPPSVRTLVQERADGNPFFAEELILTLRDRGVLRVEPIATDPHHSTRTINRCIADETLTDEMLRLPDTVEGLLLARIDRFPAERQLILRVGSVIGRRFPYAILHYTINCYSPIDDTTLKHHLDDLATLGMTPVEVLEPNLIYVFKHIMTQEVVYHTLLFTQRRALHRTVANWYEQTYGSPFQDGVPSTANCPELDPYLPLLVHHYRAADDHERERAYARLAGQQAAARFANTEAVAYLTRAIELTPAEDHAEHYALLLARESVYDLQGKRDAQREDLDALQALANMLDDDHRRVQVALRRAHYANATGDYPAVIEAAQHAIALAEGMQSLLYEYESEGQLLWGMALHAQGNYAEAQTHLELALHLACVTQFHRAREQNCHDETSKKLLNLEARCLLNLGNVAADQGNTDEAKPFYEHSLRICQRIGDRPGAGRVLNNLGVLAADLGNFAEARAYYEQDLQLCRDIGNRLGESVSLNNLGSVAASQGDYEGARTYYEQSLQLCREIADVEGEGFVLSGLGLLLHQIGQNEAARECAEHAARITDETGDRNTSGDVLTILGNVLLELGQPEEARAAYEQALVVRRELGQESKAAETLAGVARVLLAQGAYEQARTVVEDILGHLEGGVPEGTYEPFRVYLTCYQVLDVVGDERARDVLLHAYELLHLQAMRVGDAAMRRSYLENVPAHRAIIRAVEERLEAHANTTPTIRRQ